MAICGLEKKTEFRNKLLKCEEISRFNLTKTFKSANKGFTDIFSNCRISS